MEMAETTENENIDRVDIFESVEYSYKINVADGTKLVINDAPDIKGFKGISLIFTEWKNAKTGGVLFLSATIFVAAIFNLSNLKKN